LRETVPLELTLFRSRIPKNIHVDL